MLYPLCEAIPSPPALPTPSNTSRFIWNGFQALKLLLLGNNGLFSNLFHVSSGQPIHLFPYSIELSLLIVLAQLLEYIHQPLTPKLSVKICIEISHTSSAMQI